MTISVVASSLVRNSGTGSTTLTITLGAAVAAGDTLDLSIMNKSNESAGISSVSDSVNGPWPAAVVGPVNSIGTTFTHWRYVFENSGAGTPTITITFNESINSEGTALGLHGSDATPEVDVIGTTYNSAGANEASPDTAAVSATAAGMFVAGINCNVYQATPPVDAGGATEGPASTADGRTFHAYRSIASAGSEDFAFTGASATRWIISQLTYIEGGTPAPTIDDVNTDDEIEYNDTGNVVNGSNFDVDTLEIEQDDGPVEQTITADDATTITFTNVFDTGSPQLKFGAAILRVINTDTQEAEHNVTLVTDAASAYVDLTSVNPVSDYRITAVPDLEAGFQLQYGNVQGGTIADVTVYDDATFSVEPDVSAFDVRAWDVNTAEWGAWATQQVQQEFTTSAGLARDNRRRGMLNMIWGRG